MVNKVDGHFYLQVCYKTGSTQFYRVYYMDIDLAYGSGKVSLRLCGCVMMFKLISERWIEVN